MDNTELHYLTYDPEEIWQGIIEAYIAEGGDVLYPGNEKEMLLRSVQSVVTQVFAAVDNALRMQTLRYAVGDYLDVIGELRDCERIKAAAATATARFTFSASGQSRTIRAGTALTADGERFYVTVNEFTQSGFAQVTDVEIVCSDPGSVGNGLLSGAQMQLAISNPAVESIMVTASASGGNDEETDDAYRERIRTFGLSSSTAGSARQYESITKGVSSEILDAKAVNLSAGCVGVYLILEDGAEAETLIEAVEAALSASDTRPLTDTVTVVTAPEVYYTLNVRYSAAPGGDITAGVAKAVSEYEHWQNDTVGRAFNPDRLIAALYQAGATRVMWGAGSEFNAGAVEYTEIAPTSRCKGTITVALI